MKTYSSTVNIQASPATVWALLIDGAGYSNWNSGVEKVQGTIASGEQISVFSKVSPGRAFPVKVVEFVPDKKMVWSGGMPLGLFKGERTFTLSPEADGGTKFTMREEFSGPFLPLIWGSMPDLQPSFDQFTCGLKARAENN